MSTGGTSEFWAHFRSALKFVGETLAVHTIFGLGLGIVTYFVLSGGGYLPTLAPNWTKEFTIFCLSIPWIAVCRLIVSLFDLWERSIMGLEWKLRRVNSLRKSNLIDEKQEALIKTRLLNWYGNRVQIPKKK